MSTFPNSTSYYAAGFAAACRWAGLLVATIPTTDPHGTAVMLAAVQAALEGRASAEWQRAGADGPEDGR